MLFYEDSHDADVFGLFYNGFPGEEGQITEAEMKELTALDLDAEYDIGCMPVYRIEAVLAELFGLSLADFGEDALAGYTYLESTDSYYFNHSDAMALVYWKIIGTRTLDNGNIEVYYTFHDSKGVVTLTPAENGYHIVSNRWFESVYVSLPAGDHPAGIFSS